MFFKKIKTKGDGTVKVADFGLSRDTVDDGNKTKTNFGPVNNFIIIYLFILLLLLKKHLIYI